MKHNWEYKSWSQVLKIFNGKNQKAVENPNGLYPIYGSGGIMSYADDYICPENCTIIGRKGNINNPMFVPSKFWNVDTAFGLSPNDELNPRFLYYFCKIYDFEKHNKATTIPSLVKNDLLKISIPVPPMEVQHKIVAELDKINEVIEDCRKLLRTLDSLAQSLFYDFFGDPISNPKGWKTFFIKEFLSLKAGKSIKASELIENSKDGYFPCYGGNGLRGYIAKKSHSGLYNIIGRQGALCGNITLAKGEFYATEHAIVVSPLIDISPQWLNYQFTIMNLNQYAKGVAQPGLSVSVLNELTIPVPPLFLQEKFAKRIEQIDAQKKAIEETITNLQTLLDSRMDYWFN